MLERIWLLTDSGEEPLDLTQLSRDELEALGIDDNPTSHDPFARIPPRSLPTASSAFVPTVSEAEPFLGPDDIARMRAAAIAEKNQKYFALLADSAQSTLGQQSATQTDATQPDTTQPVTTQPAPDEGNLIHDIPPGATQPATQPTLASVPIPPLPANASQHDIAMRNIQYAIDLVKADQKYSQQGMELQHLFDNNDIQLVDLGYGKGGSVMGHTPRPLFSAATTIQIDITYATQADPHVMIGIATLAGTLVHELAHLQTFKGHGGVGNFFYKFGAGLDQEVPWGLDKDGQLRSRGELYYTNLGIDVRNAIVLDLARRRKKRH